MLVSHSDTDCQIFLDKACWAGGELGVYFGKGGGVSEQGGGAKALSNAAP